MFMSLPEIKSILFKHVIIIESKTASKSFVANEGGVGVFAAAMIGVGEADITSNYREANIRALKQEIRKAREKTNGILGVNIMVALTNFSMVRISVNEGVDVIFAGAGLPLRLPSLFT